MLTFEQTGGSEYKITAADMKHKKSIDGALKQNMKWRCAAVKAKLQVRNTPPSPLVCFARAHLYSVRLSVAHQDLTFDCGRMGSFQITSLTYYAPKADDDGEGEDDGYDFSDCQALSNGEPLVGIMDPVNGTRDMMSPQVRTPSLSPFIFCMP